MIDQENKEQLMRLMRYEANNIEGHISLDDYCETMVEGQKKIYFVCAATKEIAKDNPFLK